MPQFQRRPQPPIEARRVTAEQAAAIGLWVRGDVYQRFFFGEPTTKVVSFNGIRGYEEAVEGDWILKDENGVLSRMSPVEFALTYQEQPR